MFKSVSMRPSISDIAVCVAVICLLSGCHRSSDDKQSAVTVLRGRLLAASRFLEPGDIAPYREALSIFEYAVDEHVEGPPPGDVVRVAHWAVADGRRQPVPGKVGETATLKLSRLEEHPGLSQIKTNDDLPFDAGIPVFLDLNQSLGLERPPEMLRFDYGGDLSDRMHVYWLVRDQLRLVVVGNSLGEVGVDASRFYQPQNAQVPVAMNLSAAGSNLEFQNLIARDYACGLPRLEWVVWCVAPRIFNSHMRSDRRADLFKASPGYAYDRAHPAPIDASRANAALDVASVRRMAGVSDSIWGWARHARRSLPDELTPDIEEKLRHDFQPVAFEWWDDGWQAFSDTVRMLDDARVRVLLFIPPVHPVSAGCPATDMDGTGRGHYDELVARLNRLAASLRTVQFVDLNLGGRHEFGHSCFYDGEHLHATGAEALTRRLVQLVGQDGAGGAGAEAGEGPGH